MTTICLRVTTSFDRIIHKRSVPNQRLAIVVEFWFTGPFRNSSQHRIEQTKILMKRISRASIPAAFTTTFNEIDFVTDLERVQHILVNLFDVSWNLLHFCPIMYIISNISHSYSLRSRNKLFSSFRRAIDNLTSSYVLVFMSSSSFCKRLFI